MKEQLTILSLNVNGLRDNTKRTNLFLWLKLFPTDIILLQDTHYTPADNDLWTRQWGLPVVWSEFNAALSANRSLILSLVPTLDISSRLTIFTVQIPSHSELVYFGSIYVPAQYNARTQFLANLPPDLPYSLSFLAGDCNMIANPSLDRVPPSNSPPGQHWTLFSSFLQQWELTDIHRSLSNDSDQVTRWAHLPSGLIGRRIDNLFVSIAQLTLFSDTSTLHCPYSDHCALQGKMKIASGATHGCGSWKLNTSLLFDNTYIEGINRIWNDLLANPLSSQHATWEEAKSLFQAYSTHVASSKCKSHNSLISSLQEQLQSLDRLIATSTADNTAIMIERDQVSIQLADALSSSFEGIRIRSRARWI
jgi:exonuclease III